MKIREAKPEDAAAIDSVIQNTWVEAYQEVEPEEKLEEIRKMDEVMPHEELQDWIKDESTIYLVAEIEGKIVGEDTVFLYAEFKEYSEELRDSLKEKFNAFEVNTIYEKKI